MNKRQNAAVRCSVVCWRTNNKSVGTVHFPNHLVAHIVVKHAFAAATLLAIATSIDAFAVGITIALVNDPILISAAIIGIVAFAFTVAGIHIGKRIGNYVGDKFEIVGGVILILIGIKILMGF